MGAEYDHSLHLQLSSVIHLPHRLDARPPRDEYAYNHRNPYTTVQDQSFRVTALHLQNEYLTEWTIELVCACLPLPDSLHLPPTKHYPIPIPNWRGVYL